MVMLSISNQAKAGWYDTASKDHKKWAKEFYQVKDKDKYTNVHETLLSDDIKLKFGYIKFPGIEMKSSLKSGKNNFAEVIGAQEIAYNGETFHSIIVDHSKCYKGEWGNDCGSSGGSSRSELKAKGYNKRSSEHINLYNKKEFDQSTHKKYLAHEDINNLKGLEVDMIYEWKPGDLLVFDRTRLHCSSSNLVEKKIGFTTATSKN